MAAGEDQKSVMLAVSAEERKVESFADDCSAHRLAKLKLLTVKGFMKLFSLTL